MPVRAQFQTGWATFVAMKDAFDQCLYRPQVEVAREVLRARDLLIDLEQVTLHPALNEEWKVVYDLIVGIVEALKLNQPVLVALFIARRLGKATASEKAEAICTAHAQLKALKAMGGKGEIAELANWVILPPGHDSIWGAPAGPAHPPHTTSAAVSEGGRGSSGADDFSSAYMEGPYGGGRGHASGGLGHYAPTNARFHRGRERWGGRGGRGGGSGRGPAVYWKYTLVDSTSPNHPHTMCPLNEYFKCGKSGHIRQFCPN